MKKSKHLSIGNLIKWSEGTSAFGTTEIKIGVVSELREDTFIVTSLGWVGDDQYQLDYDRFADDVKHRKAGTATEDDVLAYVANLQEKVKAKYRQKLDALIKPIDEEIEKLTAKRAALVSEYL